jgi:transglutaminase-like putative cysteine protease
MAFAEAHRDIVISLAARVEVTGGAAPGGLSCDLAGLRQVLSEKRDLGPRSPLHFLRPPATPRPIRISASGPRALARTVFAVSDIVANLGLALHNEMRFDAEATTVDTPAAEAFAARHGVCQDFTHIMIIALRHWQAE